MKVYEEITSDGEPDSPEEKLRLFCSVAMRGQDWIDAEKFFDALKPVPPAVSADAKDAARYRWLRQEHFCDPPVAAVVWKKGGDFNSSEWVNVINGFDLDKLIDAAMQKGAEK